MLSRVNQWELDIQDKLMDGFKAQGAYVRKTTERYLRGRPDLRVGRRDLGQMDIELKFLETYKDAAKNTGIKKIQQVTINSMNLHGMMAIGLLFVKDESAFYVCSLLRADLTHWKWRVNLKPVVGIELPELFFHASNYIRSCDNEVD